jgi:hypothetical protein
MPMRCCPGFISPTICRVNEKSAPFLNQLYNPIDMFDIHPPHAAAHTWKDFFIHIATIVIGLFIAVGLEQIVETIHHRHQRLLLEEQMHDVLASDSQYVAFDMRELRDARAYWVELATAIAARRLGQAPKTEPKAGDPRSAIFIRLPRLTPYEAAKLNGTVALLPLERIRLYGRVETMHEFLATATTSWAHALNEVNAFKKRFNFAADSNGMGGVLGHANLSDLSPTELVEYQALIARLLDSADFLISYLRMFDAECRAILDGARHEDDLLDAVKRLQDLNLDSVKEATTS